MILNKKVYDVIGMNYLDKFKYSTKSSVICTKNRINISFVYISSNIYDLKYF